VSDRRGAIAIGISNTPPNENQTALGAEVARTALTAPTSGPDEVVYLGTITLAAANLIQEIGLFNVSGQMVARSTIAGVFYPANLPLLVEVRFIIS
jgi:hypothetical protein